MIVYREISIGSGGEVRCASCARTARAAAGPHAPDDVVRSLRAASGGGALDGVLFTGIEPFAHPHLPALIDAAREAGARRICLRTDGGALATGGNAAGALAAGVTHVELVVLADAEEHDRLTGRGGLSAACEAGARAFTSAAASSGRRVAVSGLVPVCRHNAEYAARAVARLAALGAVAVCLDARGARPGDREHVIAALDTATVNGVAGWQVGLTGEVPSPRSVAPWRVDAGEGT